jgi:alginate O-acetyltransferase complex protein AlgI
VIFSSFKFMVFFAFVLALYYAYSGLRWRNVMLLIASYLFYMVAEPRYVVLLVATTVLDYAVAHGIVRTDQRWKKKAWVWASVLWNLGVIGYFKYADFFIQNVIDVAGALGFSPDLHLLHIVVPVGVSFYNFQSMSYALDVYRGEVTPTRNFIDFALCVAFFTHLVAGPIVRVNELLPQIERGVHTRWDDVVLGVNRFAAGFTKKVLVADNLAPYVDRIFADPGSFDGLTLWCASVGFAVQCYCDFAGYTDMAIGCARLMGFWLPENFRWPFLAANVADFWRRWHITLYSFMRDYLYISLGGSRVSPARQMLNAMITMTLVGLWHGAAWNFVVWGIYNGVLVVGYRVLTDGLGRAKGLAAFLGTLPGRILCIALTDVLFFISFALFRSRGSPPDAAGHSAHGPLHEALNTIWRMLSFDGAGQRALEPWVPVAFAGVIAASLACEYRLFERVTGWLRGRPFALPLQVAGYAALIYVLVLFSPRNTQAFVYFQF